MINIDKQISHWKKGAEEDWEVANQLITSNKIRHGLFFLHLSIEKLIKAHVCRNINDISPRIHNLVRLAELSGISFGQTQNDLLAEMNPFNIEGRYPEMWGETLSREEADIFIKRAKELFEWLKNQL
ncbi:MAG: HEPN domain-containing protein [Desulfobacterales bacterium]|nr:HEPN domain-containing protein [Desulfobacterales bacterium]